MNRTLTPSLDDGVLSRLWDYTRLFDLDFRFRRQAAWAAVYLCALLQDGERKSAEPLAARVPLPSDLHLADPAQALQNFINQSPWDEQKIWKRYRSCLTKTFSTPHAIFVIDDTTFPKDGRHSVGVQRQYCGARGKKDNCQCAVSLHYVGVKGHFPLTMRLYLPQSWIDDSARLDKAGVPSEFRRLITKWEIALELLDQVRGEGLPGQIVVTDAGYGVAHEFRDRLTSRGLYYVAGMTGDSNAFLSQPTWLQSDPAPRGPGRPRQAPRLSQDSPRAESLKELAGRLPRQELGWREGTKGTMTARFSWTRVWPAYNWQAGECAKAEPVWLLVEERAGGQIKYAFSNLPGETPMSEGVAYWKSRWPVEQGYLQMKSELGLDHFEGRSWRGFHHHACLVMAAFGFLELERARANASAEPLVGESEPREDNSGKKVRGRRWSQCREFAEPCNG